MRELDNLFASLAKAAFRKKFQLQGKDLEYLHNKGLDTILGHASDFIAKRLAPALPEKDGKQTPFRGTPYLLRNMQRPVVVVGVWKNGIKFPRPAIRR